MSAARTAGVHTPHDLRVHPITSYHGIHLDVDNDSFWVLTGDGRVIASIWEGARAEAPAIARAIATALESQEER